MYIVIKRFTDMHDKDYHYNVGDVFPRDGITVAQSRIAELASADNRLKTPLIAEVVIEPAEEPADEPAEKPAEEEAPKPRRRRRKKTEE